MSTTGPVDWNYQVPHVFGRPDLWAGLFPYQNYRAFWGTAWMLQTIPVGSKLTDFDWPMGHIIDAFGDTGSPKLTHDETVQLNDALAQGFLDVVHRYAIDDWPRKVGDKSIEDNLRLEPASTVGDETYLEVTTNVPSASEIIAEKCHNAEYATCYYLKLRQMRNASSLSPALMAEVVAWTSAIWPNYPWKNFTP
jgi:hypothetical protein